MSAPVAHELDALRRKAARRQQIGATIAAKGRAHGEVRAPCTRGQSALLPPTSKSARPGGNTFFLATLEDVDDCAAFFAS
mmetsp:Transcript_111752/g.310624  ORF Transcript_111752/g.310624 Transcript_111752/m.310624 type:complete len:80 (+) Transcript_111752:545-784(+)